jgi:cob(I)alamin adenosyltransferase
LKDPKYEDKLEKQIDQMDDQLPPLKKFINPGGCPASAHLQVARAISRRVERRYVTYSREKSKNYLKFFNRLSDFLFVSSRYINHLNNENDTLAK